MEGSKRAQKQAAINHNSVEVRLNRALEEVERLKAQLSNMKQLSKVSACRRSLEARTSCEAPAGDW